MKYNIGDVIVETELGFFGFERTGYVSELLKDLVMITWTDETERSFVYTEDEVDSWIVNGQAKHYPVVK